METRQLWRSDIQHRPLDRPLFAAALAQGGARYAEHRWLADLPCRRLDTRVQHGDAGSIIEIEIAEANDAAGNIGVDFCDSRSAMRGQRTEQAAQCKTENDRLGTQKKEPENPKKTKTNKKKDHNRARNKTTPYLG